MIELTGNIHPCIGKGFIHVSVCLISLAASWAVWANWQHIGSCMPHCAHLPVLTRPCLTTCVGVTYTQGCQASIYSERDTAPSPNASHTPNMAPSPCLACPSSSPVTSSSSCDKSLSPASFTNLP